jgi:hypothetical protein
MGVILIRENEDTTIQIRNARTAKKFCTSSLRGILLGSSQKYRYSSGGIVRIIRSASSSNEYNKIYVKNST